MAEGSQFSVDLLLPTQDVAVVVANGEIDLFTAPQLQETLAEGVESGTRSVIVDLAEVPFIDSSGIDVIVSTFRRLQKDGRRLNVVCDRANVLHVFKVTGLLDLFAFYATREEALAATGEPHPPE